MVFAAGSLAPLPAPLTNPISGETCTSFFGTPALPHFNIRQLKQILDEES